MASSYCRLCAEYKSLELQIDLHNDVDKLLDINVKLNLLHLVCDFSNHELLPITVCITCYNSLNLASEFIDKVTRAQKDITKLIIKSDTVLDEACIISNTVINFESGKHLVPIIQNNIKEENVENTWDNYLWMCIYCSKVYEDAAQLRKHSIQEHNTCCAFKCADCSKKFDTFNLFADHVRNHRTYLRNYCKFCNSFETQESCISHEKWHENTYDICQLCGESFPENVTLSELSLHKATKPEIKEEPNLKELCKSDDSLSSIGSDDDLQKDNIHKEVDAYLWNSYPWLCRICEVVFDTVHLLRSHMKERHNRCAAYKCFDCNIKIGKNSFFYFIKHVGNHRENLSKVCCYCNLHMTSSKDIQKHVKKCHHKNYYCKRCGEIFKSESERTAHIKTYQTPKQIRKKNQEITIEDKTCKICNKVFASLHCLLIHTQRIHLDKKNFTCDQCGTRYGTNHCLQKHISTAHENKRILCEICKKTFMTRAGLIKHVRSHTGEKPFSCEHCGRSFKVKSLLDNHKTIHLDAKPFTCQHCNKSFRLNIFLKRHEIIHTGLKPYACKVCDVAYANRENCYNHMKKKHNIQSSNPKFIEIQYDKDTEMWKNSLVRNETKSKKRKSSR